MRRLIAFAVFFAFPLYYALRGGSYDLIARHEEAVIVWLLIGLGYGFGFLPRARFSPWTLAPLGAIGALALLTLLSLSWTESDGRTFDELARVVHYTGLMVLAISALSRYTWRAAAAGLCAAAGVVCALAVFSRLSPDAFPDDVAVFFDTNRLSYPLDYWNATAAWGAMSLAGALAWSAHARHPLVRASFLALTPFAVLSVYLSYSRAGAAGVLIAVLSVLILSRNRWTSAAHVLVTAGGSGIAIAIARSQPAIAEGTGAEGAGIVLVGLIGAALGCTLVALGTKAAGMDAMRLPPKIARVAVAGSIVFAALVLLTVGRGPIGEAWDEFKNQGTAAAGSDPAARLTTAGGNRDDVWTSALDAFETEPASGLGAGAFEFWWSRTAEQPQFIRDAHSLYFEQLAELGLPGLLITLALLLSLAGTGLRGRLRADRSVEAGAGAAMLGIFAVYLFHAGVDWMWELTAVSVLGLLAAAIAASASNPRRGRRPLAPAIRAGVVAASVAAIVIQVPGLVSTARTRESEASLTAGDLATASTLADEAVEAEPWASEPYLQRSAVAEAQEHLNAARDDLNEAIDNEATNWRPWILLSQVELQRGDEDAAEAAFNEARGLHPVSRFYTSFRLFKLLILAPDRLPPTLRGVNPTIIR